MDSWGMRTRGREIMSGQRPAGRKSGHVKRRVDVSRSSHATPAHEHLQAAEWPMLPQNVSVRTTRFSYSIMPNVPLANQNESTVRTLQLGLFIPTLVSFLLRVLLRRSSLPPSKGSLAIYIVTFFPAFFLSNYLIKIGTTRRDPTTGTLISYGEDLNQPGVTEWCFDILYVTCMFFGYIPTYRA